MKNLKPKLIFMILCLPMRILIALLPIYLNNYLNKIFSIITLIIGVSFIYAFFSNTRHFGIFNQPIWWHNIRLIHGMLFLTASIYLYNNNNMASIVLLLDVLLGFIYFLNNHFFKIIL